MTWNSTMSSGYSSLEEDSEEYFFTARTSFFKKPLGKVSENKVRLNQRQLLSKLAAMCLSSANGLFRSGLCRTPFNNPSHKHSFRFLGKQMHIIERNQNLFDSWIAILEFGIQPSWEKHTLSTQIVTFMVASPVATCPLHRFSRLAEDLKMSRVVFFCSLWHRFVYKVQNV